MIRPDAGELLAASAGILHTNKIWGRQTRAVLTLDYQSCNAEAGVEGIIQPTCCPTREKGASEEHSSACYVARKWHESKPRRKQNNSAKAPVTKAHVPARV